MALMARRYGVTRRQIVEISPLLFALIAEQSLAERKRKIDAYYDRMKELEESAPDHLRDQLRAPNDSDDDELLQEEEQSIRDRDLFAGKVGFLHDDHDKKNPFVKILRRMLEETGALCGKMVSFDEEEAPSYWIGVDEAEELLGKDKTARNMVIQGNVLLAEMPHGIRKATPEDRAQWVRKKFEEQQAKMQANSETEWMEEDSRDLEDFFNSTAMHEIFENLKVQRNYDF